MGYHLYGDAGDRYSAQPGDIWRVGAHVLACGDIEEGDATLLLEQYDLSPRMVVCDPPWGAGPARAYRSKAGVGRPVDYAHLMRAIFASVRRVRGLIALEMGLSHTKAVIELGISADLCPLGHAPMTYYVSKPCNMLAFARCALDAPLANMPHADEMAVYRWLIEQYSQPGDAIFDPCVGQGMVALAAHALDRHAVCLELHPRRMAVTLERLYRAGAGDPHKIGEFSHG